MDDRDFVGQYRKNIFFHYLRIVYTVFFVGFIAAFPLYFGILGGRLWAYILLFVFIGILGFPLALFAKKSTTCPACGKYLGSGLYSACRHCGVKLRNK